MIFSPPPRNLRAELLDLDEAPYEEVRGSLADVRRVNRYLGGARVLLEHVRGFLAAHDSSRPFTILDVATGSADQPAAMARLARKMNVAVHITAIDINAKMLKFAREETKRFPEIELVQCDIFKLPFSANSFDLVTNSLSLHHFKREDVVRILSAMFAIGRRGIIINDLHRSRVAHAVIFILTRLLTSNRLTRYDAPVSVMNAFTPHEFRVMAEEAGLTGVEVRRHFPYRIAVVGKKTGPSGSQP